MADSGFEVTHVFEIPDELAEALEKSDGFERLTLGLKTKGGPKAKDKEQKVKGFAASKNADGFDDDNLHDIASAVMETAHETVAERERTSTFLVRLFMGRKSTGQATFQVAYTPQEDSTKEPFTQGIVHDVLAVTKQQLETAQQQNAELGRENKQLAKDLVAENRLASADNRALAKEARVDNLALIDRFLSKQESMVGTLLSKLVDQATENTKVTQALQKSAADGILMQQNAIKEIGVAYRAVDVSRMEMYKSGIEADREKEQAFAQAEREDAREEHNKKMKDKFIEAITPALTVMGLQGAQHVGEKLTGKKIDVMELYRMTQKKTDDEVADEAGPTLVPEQESEETQEGTPELDERKRNQEQLARDFAEAPVRTLARIFDVSISDPQREKLNELLSEAEAEAFKRAFDSETEADSIAGVQDFQALLKNEPLTGFGLWQLLDEKQGAMIKRLIELADEAVAASKPDVEVAPPSEPTEPPADEPDPKPA